MTGRANFRGSDFALILQQCGAEAMPIVTLVSFLVGLILAFMGAIQLQQFGAQIFVADLVALGMAREMKNVQPRGRKPRKIPDESWMRERDQ